jgi:protein-tyrosine-phosphatase
MAAVLIMYLKGTGHDVIVESAGVLERAKEGGPASSFGIALARRIGIDLTRHQKRWIGDLDLTKYDLIVCANQQVFNNMPVSYDGEIFDAEIENPYPSKDQSVYDETGAQIIAAMYRVVTKYFSPAE